ncbi:MAG: 16S rRNA (cytosine(967)-C(5))-methyltransferase RsmB [Candidatus Competibacterales bacterium]
MNARWAAAEAVAQVACQGRSLTAALGPVLAAVEPVDRPLVQALSYGTLRFQPRLNHWLEALLNRPLQPGEHRVRALLWVGLHQLAQRDIPAYAAVSATVEAARAAGKPWAAGLVNGVLRQFQRRRQELEAKADQDPAAAFAHPLWWLEKLQTDWPEHWRDIATANNGHPPMTLRVNVRRTQRAAYAAALGAAGLTAKPVPHCPAALRLDQPIEAQRLPGFAEGLVSVQDAGAQRAAVLLDGAPGERILDACAAPGGKTAHLLECQPDVDLLALDVSTERLAAVEDNLKRLGLTATTVQGDATQPGQWWDGRSFDRILLDAPCSGSGVIRRHPDIKLLRLPQDIPPLAVLQGALLDSLWPLLAPGGRLLYATCSVFHAENQRVVADFLARTPLAVPIPLAVSWGHVCGIGRQLLPTAAEDGFYYTCLGRPGQRR